MAYATEGDIENYLAIDIDNSLSPQITAWSLAVDEYIDKYCNRTFKDVGQEVRYFDGDGKKELCVDIFQSINSIKVYEPNGDDVMHTLSEGRENDYIVAPYNKTEKYLITLTPVSRMAVWPRGLKRIEVDANWGIVDAPEPVKMAATQLLASIVEKGAKGGSILSESLGDYSVTFKDIDTISESMGVKEILRYYKVWEL